MEIEPPQSIFILKPSSFGDIVHTLPAVSWLKSVWPASRVTWLVNPEWAPLLHGNPDLEAVVRFPRHEFRGWSAWPKFYRWQQQFIRGMRPDLVLDFQGLLRSAVIGRLSLPRALYGMADAREGSRWLYDRIAPVLPGVPHSVERYLSLARYAFDHHRTLTATPPTASSLRFPLPAGIPLDPTDADRLPDDFVLLHPFARGADKSLTMEQVEEFCRRLAPRKIVLVGRHANGTQAMHDGCLNLLNRTSLQQLIWTIRRAAFVISVDSGPAHLAAALGRPLVAIHTWSDPRRVGPYRPDAWIWKSGQLLSVRDLPSMPPGFFDAAPSQLAPPQIATICALATLP